MRKFMQRRPGFKADNLFRAAIRFKVSAHPSVLH
jgi:hypothetical protein